MTKSKIDRIIETQKNCDYFKAISMSIMLIAIAIYFLYIAIKKTKDYKKYKKTKIEEYDAKITSFEGPKTTGYIKKVHLGNLYSYSYTINNKTYKREKYISKNTYNKGDTIKIICCDDLENSISEEEFEKLTVEHIALYYALTVGFILLAVITIITKNLHM